MKVSNRINVQKIYQDQVKKTKTEKSNGEFGKLMNEATVKNTEQAQPAQPTGGVKPTSLISNDRPVTFEASVNTAAHAVANEPDVRAERVAHIKELFDAGQYNVSAEAVADRLFASGVMQSWEA